jgi:lipopolysaccharide heptosyltransferase II
VDSPHPDILAVRFSSLGDLLLTTPLLRAIRERHPEARLTFVVRTDMADALRDNPRLTELITWDHGSPLRHLAGRLRGRRWTHRLDLHGSLRSLALRRLVGGRWSGYPKHRLRRAMIIRSRRRLGGALPPVAQRYFAAARGLDVTPDAGGLEFHIPPPAIEAADRFLAAHALGGLDRPLVALGIGAAHFTKRWPLEHWMTLARRLAPANDLVVLGGTAEREAGEAVAAAAAGRAVNAAGAFALPGTAALLRRSRAVVVGDTGVLHLATAVGTPVAALYGPTVREFGFFPYHARAQIVEHDLACRPCSAYGGPVCPLGHHRCLVDLLPAQVADALHVLTGE